MSQVLSRWEQKANWLRQENGKTKGRCQGKVADEVIEQVDEMKDLGVLHSGPVYTTISAPETSSRVDVSAMFLARLHARSGYEFGRLTQQQDGGSIFTSSR